MRAVLIVVVLGLVAGIAAATIALAAGPSFTVRCMHNGGPAILPKYGTYYFFLPEDQVKGYACNIPGRPCQIVSQNASTVVFQTPGDAPDVIRIDLSNGAILHKTAAGLEATFACRQVPNNS
jgi:hypothetical protein